MLGKAGAEPGGVVADDVGGTAEPDDRGLLAAWVEQHDEAALQALLERHRPAARRVCLRILRDPGEAEDALQEACIAMTRLDRLVEGDVAAWLRGCAAKAALQHRRARTRRRRREQRSSVPGHSPPGDLLLLVDECVELLSEPERQLIASYFYLDHTQAEIAATAGISQVAVHKRLRAILLRLQDLMRRRGARIGALGLLAALLGGTAAARLAAADLGLRTGWVTMAAVAGGTLALGCIGLALWMPGSTVAAPAVTPVAVASPVVAAQLPADPSRLVLADGDPTGSAWSLFVRRGALKQPTAGLFPTPESVGLGWEGRAIAVDGLFRGAQVRMLEMRGEQRTQIGISSARRAPPGVPYAFRLESWEQSAGVWRRALHRTCMVNYAGEVMIYVSAQYFDEAGRLVGVAPAPPESERVFPASLGNHGTVYYVTSTVRVHAPVLRLMDWGEAVALVREIDRACDPGRLQPVPVADGEETPTAMPVPPRRF